MTKHYTDEGTLLIRNSDIKDGKFEFGDNPIYLEKTFAEKNETRMHQIGDVITVHTGDVGTSAVITENEAKSIGFATIVTRPNPKIIDSNYLCSFLNTDKHKKWAVSISTGDGRTNYNLGDYFELVVPVPSIAEQKKIASYIQKLNRLITLHQRKYDKLTNVKKSMLEKMFPQNGSNAPEIRFKGFTEAWEQRKLGKLCNITTGKLDANAMVSDGQYDFYTSGIDVFKIDVAAFEGPAITIAGNGASVGYMHLADGKFNAYQRTYVLTDFLADRQFLNVAIGNELPDKIQEEVRGSGIPYIVLNMLTDLAIPFPSHEEQYAIGVYFQQLDNLITLHQRELEKLKNIKKSCLENMFV